MVPGSILRLKIKETITLTYQLSGRFDLSMGMRVTSTKLLLFVVFACLLLNACTEVLSAQTFPEPIGYVNDFARIIPSSDAQRMADLISELREKTGAEIAVVTMPDIGGEDYTEYANRLYEAWGLGQKGEDNGVLIFLTLQERKIRIEVGYGLEGILPDGKVGGILDEYVVPYLRMD